MDYFKSYTLSRAQLRKYKALYTKIYIEPIDAIIEELLKIKNQLSTPVKLIDDILVNYDKNIFNLDVAPKFDLSPTERATEDGELVIDVNEGELPPQPFRYEFDKVWKDIHNNLLNKLYEDYNEYYGIYRFYIEPEISTSTFDTSILDEVVKT